MNDNQNYSGHIFRFTLLCQSQVYTLHLPFPILSLVDFFHNLHLWEATSFANDEKIVFKLFFPLRKSRSALDHPCHQWLGMGYVGLPGLLLAPNRQGFFSSHRNPALANMLSFWVSCPKLHSFCALLCLTILKKSCLNFSFFNLLLLNSLPDTVFHLLQNLDQITSSFPCLFLFQTSQELRMLTRSLSDCKSLLPNIMIQFV